MNQLDSINGQINGKKGKCIGQVESTDTFNSSKHQATIKHLNQQYILRICDGNQSVGMNIFLVISFRGGLFVEGGRYSGTGWSIPLLPAHLQRQMINKSTEMGPIHLISSKQKNN